MIPTPTPAAFDQHDLDEVAPLPEAFAYDVDDGEGIVICDSDMPLGWVQSDLFLEVHR